MQYALVAIVVVAILISCTPRWKAQLTTDRDLPWCGKNLKVILETKRTSAPFSTTGYRTHWRWVSKKLKINPLSYGAVIDRFLVESELLQQWPKSGSYIGTETGSKQLVNAPYVFEIPSVEPLIVLMRPKMEEDGKKYRSDLLTSMQLTNHYYYGTKFLFHPDTQWFSPDTEQLPTPLKLDKNSKTQISLNDSVLSFREKGGFVLVERI